MSQHATEQTEEIEAPKAPVRAAWERPTVIIGSVNHGTFGSTQQGGGDGSFAPNAVS